VASRTAQLLADIKGGRLAANERDRTRLEALYDGEITYHDDHFARFVEALEQRGLLENTVLWVTSDHGEEFFDHGSVGHGHSLYQELLHVPLVAVAPGLAPGRIQADVGLVDVVPTSLELLGQEPLPTAQGRSRVPLLRGEPQGLYDAAFSEFLDGGRSARSRGLSLVLQGSAPPQLYDLATDPREQRNVAVERPIALRHMLALLSVHLGRVARERVHRRREEAMDDETLQQLRALGYMLE
jgi:arylsulfatase A-like enzyme